MIELRTGVDVTLGNLDAHVAGSGAVTVILTCPLDVFCGQHLGPLEWRGIDVRSVYVPHLEYAQGAMVVNYPGSEFPFIRIHETKHASGQQCEGTVLGFEFTGAPTRYYPIESERNVALNAAYQDHVREALGSGRVFFAGRLANYVYIDMDDCMRQALDATAEVLDSIGASA
jgi:UDP-galactopyranose mutase